MRIRKEYKIDTLDINKNRGIGIKVPFDPVNIFKITYTTKEQVKSNLLNYFLTNKGERYFNPEFGADLKNLLFNQMTNLDEIREGIIEGVKLYFPNIQVIDLQFITEPDKNILNMKFFYKLNTEEDSLSIQIQ